MPQLLWIRQCALTTAFLALLLGGAGSAGATPALIFDSGTGGSGQNFNQTVGWQFNVTGEISVDGLSWFDQGSNGLANARNVGIWDSTGTLLVSVVIPNGIAAPLDDMFRTVAITPIVLAPGSGYIVAGTNVFGSGDRLVCDGGSFSSCAGTLDFSTDTNVAFVDGVFSPIGSGFVRPDEVSGSIDSGFFGPSFSIVPEPSSAALALFGLTGLALRRRRARGRTHRR